MQSIYLAGKSGFIGTIVHENLSKIFNVISLSRDQSHFKESRKKTTGDSSSQILIYAAGNKNIQNCEDSFNAAIEDNVTYLQALAKSLNNPYIIYLSTDYVFNGLDGNYSFDDAPSPDTNYGKSKVMAENWLLNEYLGKSNILRVSTICSDGSSFIRYLLETSEIENSIIEVANNAFFSPTSINLLIECLSFLAQERLQGIYHLSGPRISRADFAEMVLLLYGKNSDLKNSDYQRINSFLRPDLSLKNSFLDMQRYSDKKFFQILNRVFCDGYKLEDFSERNII
jgi:dTDP-4-dehydrorhamnose reductase